MNLLNDIQRKQILLTDKARRNGLYENFGQKEVQELKDKYHYDSLIYGSERERKQAILIDNFDNWCMNFSVETKPFLIKIV